MAFGATVDRAPKLMHGKTSPVRHRDLGVFAGLPDAYEEPRHLLDASLQIAVAQAFTLKLDGKNLLDAPYRVLQGDVLRARYKTGRVLSLGATWEP